MSSVIINNNNIELNIYNKTNSIICRNLKHNIEDYPNLTSFTGWYAIWKNNLISSNYINLFEYDVNISDDLQNKINQKDITDEEKTKLQYNIDTYEEQINKMNIKKKELEEQLELTTEQLKTFHKKNMKLPKIIET
jgi:hypothetical protein